jgi:hypothetical protein
MRVVRLALTALLFALPSAAALAQANPPDPGKTAPMASRNSKPSMMPASQDTV